MNTWFLCVVVLAVSLSVPVWAQEQVELYFPNVVADGVDHICYNDIFTVAHYGEEESLQVHMEVFTNEGVLDREHTFEVAPGDLENWSDYFRHPTVFGGASVQGWARVILPAGSSAEARQNLSARVTGSYEALSSLNTDAVPAGSMFRVTLPDFTAFGDPLHAIAIVNPSPETDAEVKIEYKKYGGGALAAYLRNCQDEITVASSNRVTRFLQNDLCERQGVTGTPPGQLELTFSSAVPVVVSVMEFFPSTRGFSDLDARKVE